MNQAFLRQAIELARDNARRGGGPFGALVVRGGAAIAAGANQVTRCNDPTAHAEIVAIREACRALGGFQLAGCEIYTSCEPCPMCLGAIYWARLDRVFFAATQEDAAAAGFDDSFIYREIGLAHPDRAIPMLHVADEEATLPFREWAAAPDRVRY
jgi:guanine deaminase